MTKVPVLITTLMMALVSSGCSDPVSDAKLQEQDPLAFARYFVQTVRGPGDIATYNRFMHPSGQVEATPDGKGLGEFLLKNAVNENEYIAGNGLLDSPRLNVEDARASIFYVLPTPIEYDVIYPHSPFAE